MEQTAEIESDDYGVSTPRRKAIRLEFAVCFFFFVVMSLVGDLAYGESVLMMLGYSYATIGAALYDLASSLSMMGIIAFIIFASGDSPSMFGMVWPKLVRDILIAAALLAVNWALGGVIVDVLNPNSNPDNFDVVPYAYADRPLTFVLAAIGIVVNAAMQEVVYRGYFLSRLTEASASVFWGVLSSSLCFAAVHIYQGTAGILSSFVVGVTCSISVVLTRSLWPAILAHAAHNLMLALISWPA
jgi:membrane protease YdiL (CAAX protease family)